MITPVKDEERDRIEVTKMGLEEERRKFTEAAVRLGKEKAALEVSRNPFLFITLTGCYCCRLSGSDSWMRNDHGKSSRCSRSSRQHHYHHPSRPLHHPQSD
jgi:hypothetical protein